jgi:N-methylhydantoinase B
MKRARRLASSRAPRAPWDPVRLSLYHHLLAAVAEEMGVALGRSAFSVNIKERRDYSCAVFDGRGDLIAQAAHIPVHLGSMPLSVRAALGLGRLAPGDLVMVNDPYAGGTHLPDITLVQPVFLPGDRSPSFFVANRAHHADVGGMSPGSLPLATHIVQEGIRIPPVFLARGGRLQEDVWRLVLANVRTPDERRADLEAQAGANALGARRLVELAGRAGRSELLTYAGYLLDYAERGLRAVLAGVRPGRYRFVDYLDDDGIGSDPVPIAVTLGFPGAGGRGTAVVDFTGSAPQVAGPVNAVEAITLSCVLYALRCLAEAEADGELPTNAGALRPVSIVLPAGTVVNARYPAPVSSGNVETSQRIVDVLFGALARALPGRLPAASAGTMNNVLLGSADGAYTYYETMGGGHGASAGADGASGLQSHMTNTLNTPIEALEHAYPLRVRRYALRRGSGGRGRWRGGEGLVREIEVLASSEATVIAERRRLAPWGVQGGGPGARGRNLIRRRDGRLQVMPGKFQAPLDPGDRLLVETPGGGGYGKSRRPR